MNTTAKIIILTLPETGHVNPILGMTKELATVRQCHVIVYSNAQYESLIQATGAHFRCYKHFPADIKREKPSHDNKFEEDVYALQKIYLEVADLIMNDLVDDLEREQPDLVLYDCLTIFQKLIMKKFNTAAHHVKTISYSTTFAQKKDEGVCFLDDASHVDATFMSKLKSLCHMITYGIEYIEFCLKHHIDIDNPLKVVLPENDTAVNLIFAHPEFQPHFELFDKRMFKFVGCCVDEKIRSVEVASDSKLQQVLDKFPVINPMLDTHEKEKLVYISFGTVFNDVPLLFETVLEAISHDYFTQWIFVISTGKFILKYFETKTVPNNVFMLESVPQIELLKRASLFFTHCGMNSTMEAVHFGVPTLCFPLSADQPFIADKICGTLKLGIRLNPETVTSKDIVDAMKRIFNENVYRKTLSNIHKYLLRIMMDV